MLKKRQYDKDDINAILTKRINNPGTNVQRRYRRLIWTNSVGT